MVKYYGLRDDADKYCGRELGVKCATTTLDMHHRHQGQFSGTPSPADSHWQWLADRVREWRHRRAARPGINGLRRLRDLQVRLMRSRPATNATSKPDMRAQWRAMVNRLDAASERELDRLEAELRGRARWAADKAAHRRYRNWIEWSRDSTRQDGMRQAFRWL